MVTRAASLVGVAVLLILLPGRTTDSGLQSVLPWFTLLLFMQFAPLLWTDRPDLFAPPVMSGIVAGFGTLSTLVSFFVFNGIHVDVLKVTDPDQVTAVAERTLWASILGLGAYYLGYYLRLGVGFRGWFPRVQGMAWSRNRIVLACLVPVVAFLIAYWAFQSKVGISILDPTQLGAGKAVWRDDPTLSWMMRGVELGVLPVLFYVAWTLSRRGSLVALAGAGLAVIAIGYLVSRLGQRGVAAYVVETVLILFHYLRRRMPAVLFAAVYFFGIATANILLEWRQARESAPRDFDIVEALTDPTTTLAAHEGERQRFGSLAIVMSEFPENHPYLLGESWLPIVALPIPRWLWPEKVDHFEWQDNRIVYQLTGVPAPTPLIGILYANLSWIGIFIGMFLFGIFHRALYEWLMILPGDVNAVLLYALLLVYFTPTMIGLSSTAQYVLPTWLMMRFIGSGKRAGGQPRPA